MTEYVWTLFGQQDTDLTLASDSGTDETFGMQFSLSQNARVTGIWFYSPSGATNLPTQCGIFLISTQALILANDSPTWSGTAGSGWIKCTFDGTFPLFAGENYSVAVYAPVAADLHSNTTSFWTTGGPGVSGLTNGIITAPNNSSASVGQDAFAASSPGLTYPDASSGSPNYWIDIEVTTGVPAATPPVAGFGPASPRSWSPGDQVTTPRLRGDAYNLAALTSQARPLFFSPGNPNGPQEVAANTNAIITQNNASLNSWNTILTQGAGLGVSSSSGTATFYPVPLAGWWLVQGWLGGAPVSGGANSTAYTGGIIYTQGTALYATRTDFGDVTGTAAGTFPAATAYIGQSSAELLPFNPASGDVIGAYAFTSNSAGSSVYPFWAAEWAGLPSSGTINGVAYTGPVGTVIASPKPASLWPPGPGGTLSGSVSAGGSILTMPPVPGLRAGGTIGLDWLNSQQYQPYAETAAVASVTGGTVILSGTLSYAHSAGAPVAVPVSAAFLNEQIRDQSNFWFYPPMLRAVQGTASAQSVSSSTWTTVNLTLTGSGITNTIDNFSGWTAGTVNTYTIPVSGLYQIMGQVYLAGSTAATTWGAALIDNNGVRYQGDFYKTDSTGGARPAGPAVRRVLRLTAGQTIALQAWQSSGAAVSTYVLQEVNLGGVLLYPPRLIAVFRAF